MAILSDILTNTIKELRLQGYSQSIELEIFKALQQLSFNEEGFRIQVLDLLNQILVQFQPPRVPTKLTVGIPRFVNRKTGEVLMPGPYSVTNDHDLELDLVWADDIGPVAPQPGGTTVTSDNPAVISGGDVSANDAKVVLRVAGDGVANVTFANPGPPALSVTEQFTVGEPVATSLATENPVAVPHGTPAG